MIFIEMGALPLHTYLFLNKNTYTYFFLSKEPLKIPKLNL